MKKWMAIGMMAFAIVAAEASPAQAQDGFVDENGDGVDDGAARFHRFGRRGLRGVQSQLTEAQRAEVKAAIETLNKQDPLSMPTVMNQNSQDSLVHSSKLFGVNRVDWVVDRRKRATC